MSLKDELFHEFSLGEQHYLEDAVGLTLFDTNAQLHDELNLVLDIYEMVQDVNVSQQAASSLPQLPQNSRDKSLLCTQILTLVSELKQNGVNLKTSKQVLKFCISNQTQGQGIDSDVAEDTLPSSSSIRQIIITKMSNMRPSYPRLATFIGQVDEIDPELISEIKQNIINENQLLRDEIMLVNNTLSDPRSLSRGSIENTKIFSVEDLKQEIKSLERLYRCKKTSSPSSGPLRPSPPSNARPTFQPVPPTKASRASLTP